jgi:hypothetical protein
VWQTVKGDCRPEDGTAGVVSLLSAADTTA